MTTAQNTTRVPFHVEEQEVIYWTSTVDAFDKDEGRTLVSEKKQGEIVGRAFVSRLVTNVHPVTDECTKRGCYQKPSEEASS